jgi:uncharacterized protein
MRGVFTVLLLLISNVFMTFAWYGHLKFSEVKWLSKLGLPGIILVSWGIALVEYMFMVPANRFGHQSHGGPFTLFELKVIQEVLTLLVFTVFAVAVFKQEQLRINHLWAFCCLVGAVYFVFKK